MSIRYNYVVTLKNDRARSVNTISSWILFTSAAYFTAQLVRDGFNWLLFTGFLVMLGGLTWNFYMKRKWGRGISYSFYLLVAGLFWFLIPAPVPYPFLGLAFILLGLFEKQAKLPLEIGFSDEEIVINSLIRRNLHWQDFSNIILRDGLLTMDFRNNKLLQKEIVDDDDDADEDEFNDYCRYQLKQHP